MQIGAADSAGGQTHNGVEIVLYRRLLDSIQSNISNPMENDSFHSSSPEKSFGDFLVLGMRAIVTRAAAWRPWRPAY
jgi:hypothetical protein